MSGGEGERLALGLMTMDMFEAILDNADKPGRIAELLNLQIRELIGAKVVVLLKTADCLDGRRETIVSVCPERLRGSVDCEELHQLAASGAELAGASVWNMERGPAEARAAIAARGWHNALVLPLVGEGERQGFLIVLGLVSEDQHLRIAGTLDQMARVLGLALRNSVLYENLERIVEVRAREISSHERAFHALTEALPVGILRADLNGKVQYANERWWELGGMRQEDYTGRHWAEAVYEEDRSRVIELAGTELGSGRGISAEARFGPARTWVLAQIVAEQGLDGLTKGFIVSVTDIRARKLAEERLSSALEEKEVLLRELYHRTRNTMQMISAMLSMQGFRCKDEDSRRAFKEVENKIQGMALVQAGLYESRNLNVIDLEAYLCDLASLLYTNYDVEPSRITIELDTASVSVLIDTAIPFGLLVNELVSNSLKFAFPEGRKGRISLGLREDDAGEVTFRFQDDGVGVPQGFDLRRDGKMGLQNMIALAESQLGGRLLSFSGPGLAFELRFPNPAPKTSCKEA